MTPTLEEIQDVNFPEEGKKTPVGLPGHIFGLEEEMVWIITPLTARTVNILCVIAMRRAQSSVNLHFPFPFLSLQGPFWMGVVLDTANPLGPHLASTPIAVTGRAGFSQLCVGATRGSLFGLSLLPLTSYRRLLCCLGLGCEAQPRIVEMNAHMAALSNGGWEAKGKFFPLLSRQALLRPISQGSSEGLSEMGTSPLFHSPWAHACCLGSLSRWTLCMQASALGCGVVVGTQAR